MERAKIADVMESKKFQQNEVIIKQVSLYCREANFF